MAEELMDAPLIKYKKEYFHKNMPVRFGKVQRKILLLLLTGVALGFAYSPRKYFKVLNVAAKEFEDIENRYIREAIDGLYKSKLISRKQNDDGTVTLVITDKGKKKALTYKIYDIKIKKPKVWDGKWRLVLFDVPEESKKLRNTLRQHLKNLGFYEFQKSVFVHPYDCLNEIDYIIEFYDLRKCVRFIVAESLDNELHLKDYFELS